MVAEGLKKAVQDRRFSRKSPLAGGGCLAYWRSGSGVGRFLPRLPSNDPDYVLRSKRSVAEAPRRPPQARGVRQLLHEAILARKASRLPRVIPRSTTSRPRFDLDQPKDDVACPATARRLADRAVWAGRSIAAHTGRWRGRHAFPQGGRAFPVPGRALWSKRTTNCRGGGITVSAVLGP